MFLLIDTKWHLFSKLFIIVYLIKFQINLSAQAQKFLIFDQKLSLGVRSPCRLQMKMETRLLTQQQINCNKYF